MKIQTAMPPQTPGSGTSGRKRSQETAAAPELSNRGKPAEGRDSVQISQSAAALQSAADATRMAVETRELIAKGNREAVVAQPLDVRRLQELLRATGATRETSAPEAG